MKQYLLALVCILCLFSGCRKVPEPISNTQASPVTEDLYTQVTESSLCDQVQTCDFSAQYIRTDGYHDQIRYPVVRIIKSPEELQQYYEENKTLYYLERREAPASDYTIGFLDACDNYDSNYFAEQFLLMVLLQEGSGSVRHQVTELSVTENGELSISIDTISPEIGTSDMALWHILIEPEKGIPVPNAEEIRVYVNGSLAYDGHHHLLAEKPQNVADPVTGYCGNTMTTVKISGQEYTFWGADSVTLTEMLGNLDYSPHKVCKCLPEYKIITEFDSYGVHLSQGYARCEEGQAALTSEQVWEIRGILDKIQRQASGLTEEEIAKIAIEKCSISYDKMEITYDNEGLWNVWFYTEGVAGGDLVMMIDGDGNIVKEIYGE